MFHPTTAERDAKTVYSKQVYFDPASESTNCGDSIGINRFPGNYRMIVRLCDVMKKGGFFQSILAS